MGIYRKINRFVRKFVHKNHSFVANLISAEDERINKTVELIASENFPSEAVRAALSSSFVCKYTEGYPENRYSGNEGRYYGGCRCADAIEEYCCKKWREAFKTDYHVNVQPLSGSSANAAAYASVLNPGDTILSMSMDSGAHLTHSSPVSFVSRFYNVVTYGLDKDGIICYNDIANKIKQYKPKLVLAGASAYSREIDFRRIKRIIDDAVKNGDVEERPYFMVDMAHIAGLIVGDEHQTPFGLADIITTTTHKTLRSCRGGLIFCRKELAHKVDSAVFPFYNGGTHQNIIAAKAIGAEEACTKEYYDYIHQVVLNAKAMCDEFIYAGYDVVGGGTDNHLFMLDFTKTHPHVTGKMVQDALEKIDIAVNKNMVPGDKRVPKEASGIRIGTPAMTTRGWNEHDFAVCAHRIMAVIEALEAKAKLKEVDN